MRRHREVNAHLLLEDEPRVVRAYHTFKGSMIVGGGAHPGVGSEPRGRCWNKTAGVVLP